MEKPITACSVLHDIVRMRDGLANGTKELPEGYDSFDDWAADLAEERLRAICEAQAALEAKGYPAQECVDILMQERASLLNSVSLEDVLRATIITPVLIRTGDMWSRITTGDTPLEAPPRPTPLRDILLSNEARRAYLEAM